MVNAQRTVKKLRGQKEFFLPASHPEQTKHLHFISTELQNSNLSL